MLSYELLSRLYDAIGKIHCKAKSAVCTVTISFVESVLELAKGVPKGRRPLNRVHRAGHEGTSFRAPSTSARDHRLAARKRCRAREQEVCSLMKTVVSRRSVVSEGL